MQKRRPLTDQSNGYGIPVTIKACCPLVPVLVIFFWTVHGQATTDAGEFHLSHTVGRSSLNILVCLQFHL